MGSLADENKRKNTKIMQLQISVMLMIILVPLLMVLREQTCVNSCCQHCASPKECKVCYTFNNNPTMCPCVQRTFERLSIDEDIEEASDEKDIEEDINENILRIGNKDKINRLQFLAGRCFPSCCRDTTCTKETCPMCFRRLLSSPRTCPCTVL